VGELADVVEVGQQPLPSLRGQHPARHAPLELDGTDGRSDAVGGEQPRPAVDALVQVVERRVVGGGEVAGGPTDPGRQRERAGAVGRRGPLQRVEQAAPVGRGRRGEHAARAADHRRHLHRSQCLLHQRGLVVRPYEHRDVGGAQRTAPHLDAGTVAVDQVRPGFEQADDAGGDVGGDELADVGCARPALCVDRQGRMARHQPQPQRRRLGGADQARRVVAGLVPDETERDLVVAERGTLEQRGTGVEQAGVGPPARGEGVSLVRLPAGLQVGVDVGASEGVDRLLGVADQHQRPAVGGVTGSVDERARHDAPLHRVGVLELIDQCDAVAAPQRRACRWPEVVVTQRPVQVRQQAVVGQQASLPGAPRHLGADPRGQVQPEPGLGVIRRAWRQLGSRAADDRAPQPDQRVPADARMVAALNVGRHEQVVDDLLDQAVQVLDQLRVTVEVARDAEPVQHMLAEAVDGRDGRRVDVGQRARQAGPALPHMRLVAVGETREHRVGGVEHRAREHGLEVIGGLDESGTDTVAQLRGRRAGEGDDQQVGQARIGLGDPPGGEPAMV
jgi:hypothetical protein